MSIFTGGLAQGVLNYQQQQRDQAQQDADLSYRKMLLQQAQENLESNREARAKAQQNAQTSALMIGGSGPQPPAPGQASVPMAPPQQTPQMPPQGAPLNPPMGMPPAMQAQPQKPVIPLYQTVAGTGPRPVPQPQAAPMGPPPVASAAPPQQQLPQGAVAAPGQFSTPTLSQVPQIVNQMLSAPSVRDQAIQTLRKNGATDQQIADWLNSDNGIRWIDGAQKAQDEKLKVLTEAQKVGQDAFENELHTRQQENVERHEKVGEKQRQQEIGLDSQKVALAKERAAAERGGGIDTHQLPAAGAMAASGMPLSQVVPGYGKEAVSAREKVQQEAIRQIKAENPGMSDIDAGREYAGRQVDYIAGKRSVSQIDTMLGATRAAVDQLDFNIDQAKKSMAGLTSTNISPILNAMARGEEKWTGDPKYSSLFYYMQGVATEASRLQSGGQASIAQLHEGARAEAERWMNMNMTPDSFNEVTDAIKAEGKNRIKNFEDAKHTQRPGQPQQGSDKGRAIPLDQYLKSQGY